jgi:hypothetical protein
MHQSHQEMTYELVRTGLSAQMLGFGRQHAKRIPPADAQFSALFVRNEPVVGLLFLRSANIAGYDLPDHCRSFQFRPNWQLIGLP